jgi:hypothetical protein
MLHGSVYVMLDKEPLQMQRKFYLVAKHLTGLFFVYFLNIKNTYPQIFVTGFPLKIEK